MITRAAARAARRVGGAEGWGRLNVGQGRPVMAAGSILQGMRARAAGYGCTHVASWDTFIDKTLFFILPVFLLRSHLFHF